LNKIFQKEAFVMFCENKKTVIIFGDASFQQELHKALEVYRGDLQGKLFIPSYSRTSMPSAVDIALMQLTSNDDAVFIKREFSHDGTHVLVLDAIINETTVRTLVEYAPHRIHCFNDCATMVAYFRDIVLEQKFFLRQAV